MASEPPKLAKRVRFLPGLWVSLERARLAELVFAHQAEQVLAPA